MDDDIYRLVILERYQHMKNKRKISNPDYMLKGFNASCGDNITVYLKADNGAITDMSFEGEGCLLSQVSADILVDKMIGKHVTDIDGITIEQMMDIVGIHPSVSRIKCMSLSLETTQKLFTNLGRRES